MRLLTVSLLLVLAGCKEQQDPVGSAAALKGKETAAPTSRPASTAERMEATEEFYEGLRKSLEEGEELRRIRAATLPVKTPTTRPAAVDGRLLETGSVLERLRKQEERMKEILDDATTRPTTRKASGDGK